MNKYTSAIEAMVSKSQLIANATVFGILVFYVNLSLNIVLFFLVGYFAIKFHLTGWTRGVEFKQLLLKFAICFTFVFIGHDIVFKLNESIESAQDMADDVEAITSKLKSDLEDLESDVSDLQNR